MLSLPENKLLVAIMVVSVFTLTLNLTRVYCQQEDLQFPFSDKEFLNMLDDSPNLENAVDFNIKLMYRSSNNEEFKQFTNDSILSSGDFYKIIFTPNEHSYVYIIQIDPSGKIFKLFPMEPKIGAENSNPVIVGATYYVPEQSRSFQLDEQTGTEKICFITSPQPFSSIEKQYRQILPSQHSQDKLRGHLVRRKLFDNTQLKLSCIPFKHISRSMRGSLLSSESPNPRNKIIDALRIQRTLFEFPSTEEDIMNALNIRRTKGVGAISDDYQQLQALPTINALILFDFDRDTIKPESYGLLEEFGKILQEKEFAKTILVIAGHTDSVGSDEYNLKLSERRAKAVKNFLVSQYQIDSNRLIVIGYGERVPIASNDTNEGRAKNRRIEFIRIQ